MAWFVVVTGVPGSGKSTVASRLARLLGCRFLQLSPLVLYEGLWMEYDAERRSFVVDYEGLVKTLRGLTGSGGCVVFDTHWVEPLIDASVEIRRVIVTRCHPLVLKRRLLRRGWPCRKVVENVEAELIGVIPAELGGVGLLDAAYEVDTSKCRVGECASEALEAVKHALSRCCIDWLAELSAEEVAEATRCP